MSHHVFGDGGLGNLDTQFQQLAVNAGALQRGLLRLIIRIRSRTCCGTRGRLVTRDLTRPAVLPSSLEMEFSAPIRVFRSSIARPTDTPIYASTSTSRWLLQDLGPRWIRSLLSCRTLTFPTICRFIPALFRNARLASTIAVFRPRISGSGKSTFR